MSRPSALALALVLTLASSSIASDLMRQAAFLRLHREKGPLEIFHARTSAGGFQVFGERILLEFSKLSVTIQKVVAPDLQATNLAAQSVMPLNDAFFADPYTTGVNNFLGASTLTIGGLSMRATLRDEVTNQTEKVNLDARDIKIVHFQKAMSGSLKSLVFTVEFAGKSAYTKPNKKLTVTLESVKVGGIPVAMDLVFFFLKSAVDADFIQLAKPNLIIDLGRFFPVP